MKEKVFFIICLGFCFSSSILGQCPDKDYLRERIVLIRSNPALSSAEKLSALLKYEAGMKSCPYRGDSNHISLLRNIGAIHYAEADFLNAVKYYRQSIDLLTQNAKSPTVNIQQLPACYYWLSRFYDSLHMVGEKMKALDSCAKVAIRLKSIDRGSLWALYARVEYFYDIGDYHRCIDYAALCAALGNEYARIEKSAAEHYVSSSLIWHVNALLELKDYEAAEKLLTNQAGEHRKSDANYNLGVIYEQLAQVEISRGNFDKALLNYKEAFSNERKAGHDVNCRMILNNIGKELYFKNFNDLNKALFYYTKALGLIINDSAENKLTAIETLSILNNIANVYVRRGDYNLAHKYFQLAFDQIKPGIRAEHLLYNTLEEFPLQKRIGYIATLLIDKGDAFQQQFKVTRQLNSLREAVRIYKIADQFLDRMKSDQSDLKSKLFWRSHSRRLYENAIRACQAYDNVSDAVYFFEKSRAVLLMDQLNEQHWLNEEEILKQTQLKKKIMLLENEYNGADKSSLRQRELQDKLFGAKQELDHLIRGIKEHNPLYYQSFLDSNLITLNDIQKRILSDHDAFVEIFNGDSAVYLLVVSASHAKLSMVNKKKFDSLSRLFITNISNPDILNRGYDQFINLSRSLFHLIFENNSLPKGRIIISPEGQYFPFEALVTNTEPVTYFINDHSISYTYSARYLLNNFSSASPAATRNFMGLAPVHYSENLGLAALTGSDRSLSQIRSYFSKGDNFVASEASKNNFLQQFHNYKVIQIYSHASDSSSNGEPVIWFADSSMYLSDLNPQHQPVTSLIVLSACETALGDLYLGEGVFSFNRGFAALGIPSAISNLWSVDNESTYRLTELFYKYLAQGLPIDISLQKAKIEFINDSPKEKSLPYYWAAPILAGKTDAIDLQKGFPWKSLLFFIALGAGISFTGYRLWIIRKKKISSSQIEKIHVGNVPF